MLRSLQIEHFRNIDSLCVNFTTGCNALIGANGQGKTNILEAVYFLALLRSFRTTQLNDLKQWRQFVFTLHAICKYASDRPDTELTVIYGKERKLVVDGQNIYRTSEFINRFLCVTFIPQDLDIIQGPEALRRRFLDIAISQFSPAYLKLLQAYQEALKGRNALLKDQYKYPRSVITAYDTVLVQKGVLIEQQRRQFAAQLNAVLKDKSLQLLNDQRTLAVKYLTGVGQLHQDVEEDNDTLAARFHETLERQFERDCRDGYTHCGPHRAELACLLNETSLAHFGSAGECRLASLALKLASLHVLRQQFPQAEVTLLVDDVLGELDQQRQHNFFGQLQDVGQLFFAGTALPQPLQNQAQVMQVVAGKIV